MFFLKKINNRWSAFFLHLIVSFLIFLVLSSIIRFVWFPGFLFEVDGGLQGITLIAGVDIVVGPILTLLIFNVAKKELSRDMLIIAVMQFACICGGMAVVEHSRPIAVVFLDGKYVTVNRHSFEQSRMDMPGFDSFISGFGPAWVYVNLPDDSKDVIIQAWSFFGRNIATNTELYEPYENAIGRLTEYGILNDRGSVEIDYSGRYFFGVVDVNVASGEIVGLISKEKY
ncbi:hypothetical protein MO867_04860 [Microbulbifer sp. OS29]|uniref:Uncharacterized protein n=1 Tax=Microbulbifer okhotskensis TaxID=2926617 RepID=A0A9X2EQ40_9GAMM|nr:hypothetical protein [Microbulbifer okhotskensis]MCO1333668.1 hypothetical protein [Microbulbifer okhotskensis]